MENEERRRRGEMYQPGSESLERAGEEFEEGGREFRRQARRVQHEMGHMAEHGRDALTATRERVTELGEHVNFEPRWTWLIGAITMVGAAAAVFLFFMPKRTPMLMSRKSKRMRNEWLSGLGDRIVKFGDSIRSMSWSR